VLAPDQISPERCGSLAKASAVGARRFGQDCPELAF
jgi:hypothetical protein